MKAIYPLMEPGAPSSWKVCRKETTTRTKNYFAGMLDDKFCDQLERKIGNALELMAQTDERLRGFWCDGVILPLSETDYTKKQVNDRRWVRMTVFTGKTGQEEYELTLYFGRKALSRYARDLSLEECVPGAETAASYWLEIDPIQKKMAIQLY